MRDSKKQSKKEKKETIKATLVYAGSLWDKKVFIDGTEKDAEELAYYIKRWIQAVNMLNEDDKIKEESGKTK